MDPQEFVEMRTRRYMAQALEAFENRIEKPLRALPAQPKRSDIVAIVDEIEAVKRIFRKKLLALGTDCLDVARSDVEINALELVRR